MRAKATTVLICTGLVLAACSSGLGGGRTLTPAEQADFANQMVAPGTLSNSEIPPADPFDPN